LSIRVKVGGESDPPLEFGVVLGIDAMTDEVDNVEPRVVGEVEQPDRVRKPDKEKPDPLEIAGTVLLGIAAVLIAWTTYQAGLWGGVQDTRNTASALSIVDAADDLGRADSTSSLDQLLFVDWIVRLDDADPDADLLFSQMSPEGQDASLQWLDNDEVRPFDIPAYVYAIYGEGIAKRDAAFGLFDAAADANQNGDDYTLAATIVALVLFLSGVSLVLKGGTTRIILMVGSGAVLVGVTVYVLGLPRASGARSVEELEATLTEEALAALAEEQAAAEQSLIDEAAIFGMIPGDGDDVFAVYLDVVPASEASDDLEAEFSPILEQFEDYNVLVGALSCDEGAAEWFGLVGDEQYAAAVYFETAEEATTFASSIYDEPGEAVVEVRVLC
jgi:hypothetical protein